MFVEYTVYRNKIFIKKYTVRKKNPRIFENPSRSVLNNPSFGGRNREERVSRTASTMSSVTSFLVAGNTVECRKYNAVYSRAKQCTVYDKAQEV